MNRPDSPSRPLRQAGAILLAALALVASLATVAALGAGRNAAGAVPSAPPSPVATAEPTTRPTATPTAAATPEPTAVPTAVATEAPPPEPTEVPSEDPRPTDGGSDAIPLKVDLDNATGADVYVDIVDHTGDLAAARTGDPGDGASVEPNTLQVRNLDQRTFELTWVDYPVDNALALYITREGDGYRLVLIQPDPTEPTDAVVFDRMLILEFDHDVDPEDIEAELQGAENNAG